VPIGLGRLRLGIGLAGGLWENSHMTAHPTESEPPHRASTDRNGSGEGQVVDAVVCALKTEFDGS